MGRASLVFLLCTLIFLAGGCSDKASGKPPEPAVSAKTDDGSATTPDTGQTDAGSATVATNPEPDVKSETASKERVMHTLQRITADLPADIQSEILANPEGFLAGLQTVPDLPVCLYRLVDRDHALPENSVPETLTELDAYPFSVNKPGMQIHSIILEDLQAMVRDVRAEGLDLMISSAYRSYSYQAAVYARHVENMGREEADRVSARPGTSQHQLGTTLDFGSISDEFGDTPEGIWLKENAWRYGFSLSYPAGYEELTGYSSEIWHYRYLGRALTIVERQFFNGIQQYLLQFLHHHLPELETLAGKEA